MLVSESVAPVPSAGDAISVGCEPLPDVPAPCWRQKSTWSRRTEDVCGAYVRPCVGQTSDVEGVMLSSDVVYGAGTLGAFLQGLRRDRTRKKQRNGTERAERRLTWTPTLGAVAERQLILQDELKALREVLSDRAARIAETHAAVKALLGEVGTSPGVTATGHGAAGDDSAAVAGVMSTEGLPAPATEPVLRDCLTSKPRVPVDQGGLGLGADGDDFAAVADAVSSVGIPPPSRPWASDPACSRGLDRLGAMFRQFEELHPVPRSYARARMLRSRSVSGSTLGSQGTGTTLGSSGAKSKSTVGETVVEDPEQTSSKCHDRVGLRVFEKFCLTVILVHAIMMGVGMQVTAGSSESVAQDFFQTADTVCLAWYAIEVVLKLGFLRRDFFCGPDAAWNIFDVACLVPFPRIAGAISGAENGEGRHGTRNMAFVRSLRALKMLKLVRVIRILKFCRELRLLLNTLIGTCTTLFWTLFILALLTYTFGLLITLGTHTYLVNLDSGAVDEVELHDDLLARWGGIGPAMLTLFMALTGGIDWIVAADPLRETSIYAYIMFFVYIALLQIALLNIMVGIFCECAVKISGLDLETVILEEEKRNNVTKQLALALFENMDQDRSGVITKDEWERSRDSPPVRKYFSVMNLDGAAAEQLFQALGGEDGEVDIGEFLQNCKQLRGDCQRRQILQVVVLARLGSKLTSCVMAYVEDAFREIFLRVVDKQRLSRTARLPLASLKDKLRRAKVPIDRHSPRNVRGASPRNV